MINTIFAGRLNLDQPIRGNKNLIGGEIMNKKLSYLLPMLGVIILLTASVPVIAVSPDSVPAVLLIDINKVQNTIPEKEWITEDGILQQRGIIRTVDFDINEPGATLEIDGEVYVISIHAIVDVKIDLATNNMINHYHKWTITLPVQDGISEEGQFVGTNIWKLTFVPSFSFTGHGVLQGSGAFEGQTLKLTINPVTLNYEGYLMP